MISGDTRYVRIPQHPGEKDDKGQHDQVWSPALSGYVSGDAGRSLHGTGKVSISYCKTLIMIKFGVQHYPAMFLVMQDGRFMELAK